MLTHIGVLTLKDSAGPDERRAIADGLEALVGQVDGLVAVRTGVDLGLKDDTADVVFELTFTDEEAWRAYATHPAHKALIAERIAPHLEAKVFLQVAGFDDADLATLDYSRAGLQSSVEIGSRPALVVIDPARAYVDPQCPLYAGVEDAVERMKQVLGMAREAGIPTIITRVEHDPTGRDGGIFVRKVPALRWFKPDSPYAAYIDGLEPREGDIEIVKQYPSAFAHTSLAATLTSLGVDTLLITGLSTSGCVRATATDAMQNGFVPVVVEDACGDRLPGPHRANLFDIRSKVGEVVTSAQVPQILARATA